MATSSVASTKRQDLFRERGHSGFMQPQRDDFVKYAWMMLSYIFESATVSHFSNVALQTR